MMRRLLQPFWVLLAVIFLIEAWLWDCLLYTSDAADE